MHACEQSERAARVDAVHQVVALHRRLERAGEADGARVVHQDVDAAEGLDRLLHRRVDLLLVADVDDAGERLAARPSRSPRPPCRWCRAASGAGSVVLAAMAMLAPSRAARRAMARPMPRLAPVMKSVFPLRVGMRRRTLSPRSRRAWARRSGRAVAGARPSSAARRRGQSTRRCGRCRRGPAPPRAGDAMRARWPGAPRRGWAGRGRAAPPPRPGPAAWSAAGRGGAAGTASERRRGPRGSPAG